MKPENRSNMPSEMGSTWLRSASADHSSISSRNRSGSSAARSTASEKSSDRLKSSHRSSSKSRLPMASSSSSRTPVLMWFVVAFHPSWKIDREPNISHY